MLKINLFAWVRERFEVGGKDNFAGFQIPIVATTSMHAAQGGRMAQCGAVHIHRVRPQPNPFPPQPWLWPTHTHWLNIRICILGPCESGLCCCLFFKVKASPEFRDLLASASAGIAGVHCQCLAPFPVPLLTTPDSLSRHLEPVRQLIGSVGLQQPM